MDKWPPIEGNDEKLDHWMPQSADLPAASPEFCRAVMADVTALRLPWHIRARRFVFRPRQLQWNMITVMTPAAMTIAVLAGFIQYGAAIPESAAPVPGTMTINVRFQLPLNGAQHVALTGDFNQWQPNYPLKKGADGVWSVEVPLPPGRYEYMFVVDGERWANDPGAAYSQNDGFGGRNSVRWVGDGESKGGSGHAI